MVDLTEQRLVLELDRSLFYKVLGILTVVGWASFYLDSFIFLTKFFNLSVPELMISVLSFIDAEDLTERLSS